MNYVVFDGFCGEVKTFRRQELEMQYNKNNKSGIEQNLYSVSFGDLTFVRFKD